MRELVFQLRVWGEGIGSLDGCVSMFRLGARHQRLDAEGAQRDGT